MILLLYPAVFLLVLVLGHIKWPRKPMLSRQQEITERLRKLRKG